MLFVLGVGTFVVAHLALITLIHHLPNMHRVEMMQLVVCLVDKFK